MIVKFSPVDPQKPFKAPERGSEHAAGYDIHSAVDIVVPAGERRLVSTNLKFEIPKGFGGNAKDYFAAAVMVVLYYMGISPYCRLAPRSGLAYKKGIDVLAGVVDSDYRGEVKVILHNNGDEDFEVKVGERIAQTIFELKLNVTFEQADELSETERGEGGFGSTGK